MTDPTNMDLFRVVCPDGLVADDFEHLDDARWYAVKCDRAHDEAVCGAAGKHRVLRATWTEVPDVELWPPPPMLPCVVAPLDADRA